MKKHKSIIPIILPLLLLSTFASGNSLIKNPHQKEYKEHPTWQGIRFGISNEELLATRNDFTKREKKYERPYQSLYSEYQINNYTSGKDSLNTAGDKFNVNFWFDSKTNTLEMISLYLDTGATSAKCAAYQTKLTNKYGPAIFLLNGPDSFIARTDGKWQSGSLFVYMTCARGGVNFIEISYLANEDRINDSSL